MKLQALKDQALYASHFLVKPPCDLQSPALKVGRTAAIVCANPEANEDDRKSDRRHLILARYGLDIPWANDATGQSEYLFTAKIETIAENKVFGSLWAKGQRCIIPIAEFIKQHWPNQRYSVPMPVSSANGEPLGVAGIWSVEKSRQGVAQYSFAMLTTGDENGPVVWMFRHGGPEVRMPLILARYHHEAWLHAKAPEDCISLIQKRYRVELATQLQGTKNAPAGKQATPRLPRNAGKSKQSPPPTLIPLLGMNVDGHKNRS